MNEGTSGGVMSKIQFGGTMTTTLSQTKTTDVSNASPRTRRNRHNVILFPNHRDRLACDPLNFFVVYATYEYRWSDTTLEAERNIFALVDSMLAAVRKAFDESFERWKKMPAFVQYAHTLRSAVSFPSAFSTNTLFHAYSHADNVARHTAVRKTLGSMLPSLPASNSRQEMNICSASSAGRSTVSKGVLPRAAHRERREEEEEVVTKNLAKQWIPPHNGPKCRLVLDIVASRKTLGDDPVISDPYRLGQKVFTFTRKNYLREVINTFVGISDSGVTLVGRDILYPFRSTGGGNPNSGVKINSLSGNRRNLSGSAILGSPIDSGDVLGVAASGGVAAKVSGIEQILAKTIPVPRMVPVPPTNTEKVDNIRLLVCLPSNDISSSLA
ncbi:hypothetical protein MOQ_003268 [Trypanosoma cruzi marinkellei]|uniref:Uncharacterized protein n=1 Tax=Trypanosoma cruzi marinkellei TaxID=85056 RepID=K2MCD3_TRYCR|nr:hypothetical protein MOQ_003268 [Trypanosoma cruzi marinkellei]